MTVMTVYFGRHEISSRGVLAAKLVAARHTAPYNQHIQSIQGEKKETRGRELAPKPGLKRVMYSASECHKPARQRQTPLGQDKLPTAISSFSGYA